MKHSTGSDIEIRQAYDPIAELPRFWNSISLISEPFSPRQKSGDSGVCRDKLPFRGCLER